MTQIRCTKCQQLLAKVSVITGLIEIKCYSCNEMNGRTFKSSTSEISRSIKYNRLNTKITHKKGGELKNGRHNKRTSRSV